MKQYRWFETVGRVSTFGGWYKRPHIAHLTALKEIQVEIEDALHEHWVEVEESSNRLNAIYDAKIRQIIADQDEDNPNIHLQEQQEMEDEISEMRHQDFLERSSR